MSGPFSKALGGNSASPVQQSPTPVAPPTGGSAAGSPLDPIDEMAVKYGWGPAQVQHMKEMRGHIPSPQAPGPMSDALFGNPVGGANADPALPGAKSFEEGFRRK